jgi:hypothetical protein
MSACFGGPGSTFSTWAVRFVDVDSRRVPQIDEIPRTSSISTRQDPLRSTNLGSRPNFVDVDALRVPEVDETRLEPPP